VFDLAQSLERVLLTHNAEDFRQLHAARPGHHGIMAVYRDGDPRKNMTYAHICTAIQRLETSGVTVAGLADGNPLCGQRLRRGVTNTRLVLCSLMHSPENKPADRSQRYSVHAEAYGAGEARCLKTLKLGVAVQQ
jgi:hypothetical protein